MLSILGHHLLTVSTNLLVLYVVKHQFIYVASSYFIIILPLIIYLLTIPLIECIFFLTILLRHSVLTHPCMTIYGQQNTG